VLLARQHRRLTTLKPLGPVWGHLLDWTVGYGYRPWLAALWLAVLLAAGTVTFAITRALPVAGGPILHFNPFIYTLDLLTPIGVFGLRNAFTPLAAPSGSPTPPQQQDGSWPPPSSPAPTRSLAGR